MMATFLKSGLVPLIARDDLRKYDLCLPIEGPALPNKEEKDLKNGYSNQISKKNPSYINVLKIINNYFNN